MPFLLALVFGGISPVIVAFVHLLVQEWTDFVLIDFTKWFVLPFGAFVLGFLGAIGVSLVNLAAERVVATTPVVGALLGVLTWYLCFRFMANHYDYPRIWDLITYLVQHEETTLLIEHEGVHHHVELGEL